MTLLDAGPLVALLDRRERYHDWSVARLLENEGVLWTCGAVMSEACFLVRESQRAVAQLNQWLENGDIRFAGEEESLWARATRMMQQYANVPMSFADACLVALADAESDARIFTLDSDFLIYRGKNGKPLSVIAPFTM